MIPCLLIIGNLIVNLNLYHNCTEEENNGKFYTSCAYYSGGSNFPARLNIFGLPFNSFKEEVKKQCGKLK